MFTIWTLETLSKPVCLFILRVRNWGVGGETAYAFSLSFNLFGKNEEEGLGKPQIHYLNILRLQVCASATYPGSPFQCCLASKIMHYVDIRFQHI